VTEPGRDGPPLPIEALEFLTWLAIERGRAAGTIEAYRRDLRGYTAWLASRGRSLDQVVEDDLVAWLATLVADGLAPATVKRAAVAARQLHRYLAVEAVLPTDPGADVETPRVPAALPKALTEVEVTRLLDAVEGDKPAARRDRALLEVLYGTGLRIAELVGLSLGDVDLDGALLRAMGKGRRERIVPIGRLARQSLEAWFDPGGRPALVPAGGPARRGDAEAVFLNQRGGRLTRQGAWLVVTGHGEAAGLAGRLSPHVLRHSCATHMLDRGADIRAVQELLGHASISTTQTYTKVTTDRLWRAYDAAHPRARHRR
jgi:integrase/recombinase XerD